MTEQVEREIAKYRHEIEELEEKRKKYEDDYAILVDQEMKLAQLYVIGDNTEYLTRVLDDSIKQISEVYNNSASGDKVPTFSEVFDFSELVSSGAMVSKFMQDNSDAQSDFKTAGKEIDELKTQLAAKISECNVNIDLCERKIVGLQRA